MPKEIVAGTIFIKTGAVLPKALRIETEPFVADWLLVKNLDGYGLDRKMSGAGWTFFCLSGAISATAFGFKGQNTQQRAIVRLLANAGSGKFNCVGIVRTVSKLFLGVSSTTVYARSRHIQKNIFLFRGEDAEPCSDAENSKGLKPIMSQPTDTEPLLRGPVASRLSTTAKP